MIINKPRKNVISEFKNIIKNDETINRILQEVKNISEDINNYVLNMSAEQKDDINSEDMYLRGRDELVKILVLVDIIDIIKTNKTGVNRLPSSFFMIHNEDIEHIFPKTPMGGPRQNSEDDQKKTDLLNEYICIINELDTNKITRINSITQKDCQWDNEEWVITTERTINNEIMKFFPLNSLGNLCILNNKVNRRYGNDFFLEKRIDIMENSSSGNTYIRPHVLDAFNKTFLKRNNKDFDLTAMTHWSVSDIYMRRASIITMIDAFLSESEEI